MPTSFRFSKFYVTGLSISWHLLLCHSLVRSEGMAAFIEAKIDGDNTVNGK